MAETTINRAYFSGLLQSVAERGRALVGIKRAEPLGVQALLSLSVRLLKGRGEASGAATARAILDGYGALGPAERRAWLEGAATRFGPDLDALAAAARAFLEAPDDAKAADLSDRAEPTRQELIRRLNHAPGGTLALVRMREDILDAIARRRAAPGVRSRFPASVRILVQSRLPRAAADRLDDAGQYSGEDHPLRSGARDQRLGRSAPPVGAAGSPALCVLSSRARRRTSDLRRGGADRRRSRTRSSRCSRPNARRSRPPAATTAVFYSISNAQRGLAGRQFRQFPDQAGRRGSAPGIAATAELRHAVARARLRRLARGANAPTRLRRRSRARRGAALDLTDHPRWTAKAAARPKRSRERFRRSPRIISSTRARPRAARSIPSRAFTSGTARGWSASIRAATSPRPASSSRSG